MLHENPIHTYAQGLYNQHGEIEVTKKDAEQLLDSITEHKLHQRTELYKQDLLKVIEIEKQLFELTT